jgi:hypothetical protein
MRAVLKSLDFEPDPSTLSADPAEFSLLARMLVGPPDSPGEESFDVTVCTPEWLGQACRQDGGIYNPRHHLVVNFDQFDAHALHAWLSARVQEVQTETWAEVGAHLGRLGHWEFEDYRD